MPFDPMDDFKPVRLLDMILAIMADGRWYTATNIRKRVKRHRGGVNCTLQRARLWGYLRRAQNPHWSGRPNVADKTSRYVYQATGKPYDPELHRLGKYGDGNAIMAGFMRLVRDRDIPEAWRDLLK